MTAPATKARMPPDSLYQALIIDHSKNPRNFGRLRGEAICIRHENPSCGDRIELQMIVADDGKIQAIKFCGHGCAISQASASMMTVAVQGKSLAEAGALMASFFRMLNGEDKALDLGELQAFAAVRQFPTRSKCAELAWKALARCLDLPSLDSPSTV